MCNVYSSVRIIDSFQPSVEFKMSLYALIFPNTVELRAITKALIHTIKLSFNIITRDETNATRRSVNSSKSRDSNATFSGAPPRGGNTFLSLCMTTGGSLFRLLSMLNKLQAKCFARIIALGG
ncbi:hypothetical protein ACHAW5_010007 [Stephanodiscus triporus]|uniref:Uncharacterized protein n=1 Tax=Stephanodiscus triporus TaxID=2934178 RepID=A0ABD3NIW0_9STRA